MSNPNMPPVRGLSQSRACDMFRHLVNEVIVVHTLLLHVFSHLVVVHTLLLHVFSHLASQQSCTMFARPTFGQCQEQCHYPASVTGSGNVLEGQLKDGIWMNTTLQSMYAAPSAHYQPKASQASTHLALYVLVGGAAPTGASL
jgi:hypothetical protein